MARSEGDWFGVRCIFRWDKWDGAPFEERITLWQTESMRAAVELAEVEAQERSSTPVANIRANSWMTAPPTDLGHLVRLRRRRAAGSGG